jgi:hypothetical protein
LRVNNCSSCGREVSESVTICAECERWAADSIPGPSVQAPVSDERWAADSIAAGASESPSLDFGDVPEPAIVSPAASVVPPAPFVVAPREAAVVPPAPSFVPSASAVVPPPSSRRGLGRRELLMIVVALGGGAIVAFALLSNRAPATAAVAAAPAAAAPVRKAPPSTRAPATVHQKWNSGNRAEWVGNQRGAAAFELPAENTVSTWMSQVRPMLVVRCVQKNTQVLVWTGSALKMEPQSADHTVTFRFDDEPGATELWADSEEHDALFAPDGAAFVRRLLPARTLRFGYTPHNAAPAEAEFQVGGLGAMIETFAKECGWKKTS